MFAFEIVTWHRNNEHKPNQKKDNQKILKLLFVPHFFLLHVLWPFYVNLHIYLSAIIFLSVTTLSPISRPIKVVIEHIFMGGFLDCLRIKSDFGKKKKKKQILLFSITIFWYTFIIHAKSYLSHV